MGDNDDAQNFTIGDDDGSTSVGVVQNITSTEKTNDIAGEVENSEEVNLNEYEIVEEEKNSKEVTPMEYDIAKKENNSKEVGPNEYDIPEEDENSKEDNIEEYDIFEEEENSKEVNRNEYDIVEEEKNSKGVNTNEFDIVEKEKNLKEDNPKEYDTVEEKNNLKEVNLNEYDIVKEDINSKEVNSNEYDIAEEEKNSKEVNPNAYDTAEEEKVVIDSKNFIGCDIYKEFEGVKSLGTVTTYMNSLKLFEVMYKNDSRLEYLNRDEVLSYLVEKDKTYKVQQVEPPRNILEMESEFEREEAALREKVTSKRKMEDSSIIEGKSSNKKGKNSSGSSSRKAINIEQIEVTLPPKESAKSKKNENSKSTRKSIRKELKTKYKPWHAKRENATNEEPYEPYQFRGLYICKELNGIRFLGTVIGYSPNKNKLVIKYKSDDSIEYMTQLETLRSMAKLEDIMPTPSASGLKNKIDNNNKKDDIGKASTSGTKKRTASGGPKV